MRGIITQRIFAVTKAPVIHNCPLIKRISFNNVINRNVGFEFVILLSLENNSSQKLIISSVVVKKMFLTPGRKLRRKQ